MSIETPDQLTVVSGPATPLTGDLVLVWRPTVAVLESMTYSNLVSGLLARSQIAGLTLSTVGASSSFGVTPGQAADSGNAVLMNLASAYTKTTGAWVVGSGNGAIDTGTIANSTWYHVYLIERTDTGVVDVIFSLSPTAPAFPTNYSLYRRIGAMLTDTSAHWVQFVQTGDTFLWTTPTQDYSSVFLSNASSLVTARVPTGVTVTANLGLGQVDTSGATNLLLAQSPLVATQAAGSPAGNAIFSVSANGSADALTSVLTNTSAQYRVVAFGNSNFFATTIGWVDRRGKDS